MIPTNLLKTSKLITSLNLGRVLNNYKLERNKPMENIELLNFYVAGLRFHSWPKVKNLVNVGSVIELVGEPDNEFDSNAVQLRFQDIMIGYVPKKFSAQVSAYLEVGGIKCIVTELNPEAKPYLQVGCSIVEDES
jgi:hypothetical protein